MGIGDCPPRGPFAHHPQGVGIERYVSALRKAGLAGRAGKELGSQAIPSASGQVGKKAHSSKLKGNADRQMIEWIGEWGRREKK